jgi:DNA ligase (NAD+)
MTAEKKQRSTQLAGLTFVLTGTLPTLTRDEAKEADRSRGRQDRRLRQQEDQLRGRRRRSRLQARQSPRTKIPVTLDEAGTELQYPDAHRVRMRNRELNGE